jgi:amino acid adenylation domain-containing protein
MTENTINAFYLSPVQRSAWMHQQHDVVPYLCLKASVKGTVEVERMKHAVETVAARHDILHTVYVGQSNLLFPLQVLKPALKPAFYFHDLQGIDPQVAQLEVLKYSSPVFLVGNISQQSPFEVHLVHWTAAEYLLIINIASVSSDGVSMVNIFNDLCSVYGGLNIAQPATGIKYAQYAEWQNKLLQQPEKEAIDFWENMDLSRSREVHKLMGAGRLNGEAAPGNTQAVLDAQLVNSLQELADREESELASVLAAAWLALLHKHTGSESIMLGEVSNKRPYEELDNSIGLFSKTLPLSARFTDTLSFTELVRQVDHARTEAKGWEDYYSYGYKAEDYLADETAPGFTLGFELLEVQQSGHDTGNASFSITQLTNPKGSFHCKLNCFQYPGKFVVELDYNDSYLSGYPASLLFDQYIAILKDAAARPSTGIRELDALPATQERLILQSFNTAGNHGGDAVTVRTLFDKQVKTNPNSIAVVSQQGSLSFHELDERVNQLANYLLTDCSLRPGRKVIVKMRRSEDLIIALLAVLKSGCAYVPLDVNIPAQRLKLILQDCKAALMITDTGHEGLLPVKQVAVEHERELIDACAKTPPAVAISPADLCYVIYTSGSTGTPKGVLITHANLVNYASWVGDTFNIDETDSSLLFSSIAFDLSYTMLWPSLLYGAALHLLEETEHLEPEKLISYLIQYKISFIKLTPSHFNILVNDPEFDENIRQYSLRMILSGGEALHYEDVIKLLEHRNDIAFINHYGPTETTVGTIAGRITLEAAKAKCGQVLGKPINNNQVYIFTKSGRLAPVGITGEICISGKGLAKGYQNKDELTKASFVDNPVAPGQRMYKTGDLGRWLPSGKIEFLGREDFQVKIRGYRIELAEIENALLQFTGIEQAVAVALTETDNSQRLVAYFKSGKPIKEESLQQFLPGFLPEYMIPARFIQLDSIPLTANGKVNRAALPHPNQVSKIEQTVSQAPRNSTEALLVKIFREILGDDEIGIHDDFFEKGGHSLKAVRLISQIFKELKFKVELKTVFDLPTVASLAALMVTGSEESYQEIPQVPVQDTYELSNAQLRMWVLCKFEKATLAYNMVGLCGFTKLDRDAFDRAFSTAVQRHEILRTIFVVHEGVPRQKILPYNPEFFFIKHVDLRRFEDAKERASDYLKQEMNTPFDLENGPLIRCTLLQLGPDLYQFIYNMHHIISDGWSNQVLIREMADTYNTYMNGSTRVLPPLRIQYKDYAAFHNKLLTDGSLDAHRQYWLEQFKGEIPKLDFPAGVQRPPIKTYNGCVTGFDLGAAAVINLERIAQENGATLFMVLLAITKTLLFRYTGQNDIIIGSPVAGREHADLENQMGFYVNTLALRTKFEKDDSFLQLLQKVKATTLNGFQHQAYPFDRLLDELDLDRDVSRSPLFDVMVQLKNYDTLFDFDEAHMVFSHEKMSVEIQTSQFDLSIDFKMMTDQRLNAVVEYNTDLFQASDIDKLVTHLQQLLHGVPVNASLPLGKFELLTAEDRRLLEQFNATDKVFPSDKTVVELVQQQVLRNPGGIAVRDGKLSLTYAQVWERSNKLANLLLQQGLQPEGIVGVLCNRSAETLVQMLGILKAGGVYLPMATSYPWSRIGLILQESGATALITTEESLNQAALHMLADDTSVSTIIIPAEADNDVSAPVNVFNITDIDKASSAAPPVKLSPDALAYIIYTSGSTGKPKGAMVEHIGMVNHLFAKVHELQLNERSIIVQNASQTFDISIWQMLAALITGGTTVVYDDDLVLDVNRFVQQVAKDEVTVLEVVPSYLSAMLDMQEQPSYPSLQHLMVTGEAVKGSLLRRWFNTFNIPVVNAYGPTEASDDITHYTITSAPEGEQVPIGRAIQNMRIYIVDEQGQLVPIGMRGEIWVSGTGVGRGYVKDAQKTNAAFMEDPFRQEKGVRLYRTGDIGRYREDGVIEFYGRKDSQVKIRGFRIELGEIENRLAQFEQVNDAVVVVREEKGGGKFLAAYFTGNSALGVTELQDYLRQYLPEYMIPASYRWMESFPLNANGKVDRNALPETEVIENTIEHVAPRTELEKKIATIWEEILDRKDISIHANFFLLGGHSLKATRMIYRIYKDLNVNIELKNIFSYPTIESLAPVVKAAGYQAFRPISPLEAQPYYDLSHAQQRLWILSQRDEELSAYTISEAYVLTGELDLPAFEQAFKAVAERHEILRTTFTEVSGQPKQVVHASADFPSVYTYTDLRAEADTEAKAKQLVNAEATTRFELEKGPLWKAGLLQVAANRYVLALTFHHIISDGWSYAIFIRDVLTAYEAFHASQPLPFRPLPIQYKDFAAWQNSLLEDAQEHRNYWMQQLSGELPKLELPMDFERPQIKETDGAREVFHLDAETSAKLKALADQHEATTFMSVLALLNAFLYGLTGQHDIIIGSPVAGRNHPDLEDQAGLYINTLPLRCTLNKQEAFHDLIDRTKQLTLDAFEHQVYPFDKLVEDLKLKRDFSRSLLFDIGFTFQNLEGVEGNEAAGTFGEIQVGHFDNGFQKVKTDIWFHAREENGEVLFSLTYNKSLFRQQTIRQMVEDLLQLAGWCIDKPGESIGALAEQLNVQRKARIAKNQSQERNKKLEKFFTQKKKTVNLAEQETTTTSLLDNCPQYPLVVKPATEGLLLPGWISANRQSLTEQLHKHGAILLRGFDVNSAKLFQEVAASISEEQMEYKDQSSPRSLVAEKLYTSTDHPADQVINMHNELSYSHNWPMRIMFYCQQPAEVRGETPIADSRQVLAHLSESTCEKFSKHGLLYVRNLVKGLGLSWQDVYQTSDKEEVEAHCRSNNIEFEWKGDNHLRIQWKRPAIRVHPLTKEKVWFNHGFFFNAVNLDQDVHFLVGDKSMLPFNTYYGNGQEIEPEVLQEIAAAYEKAKISFPWQKGDVLLLDNMLMSHGRNSFTGSRKILVAMNTPHHKTEEVEVV